MLGWGSNRALELGLREDVRMVLRPEVIKTVRGVNVVQVASSPVATGEKLFLKKKIVKISSGKKYLKSKTIYKIMNLDCVPLPIFRSVPHHDR